MSTDNRTNEPTPERVERAYRAFCEARLGRAMTDEEHEATRSRLELTWIGPTIAAAAVPIVGAPTEAQVEAAAKVIRRASLETTANPGDFWSDCYEGEQEAWRNAARAALEAAARAAQGAAPQAAKDIHEPNHDRVYCVRCGGNWPCQPAPVLPSSGVDEDKLAEVIGRDENYTRDIGFGGWTLSPRLAARAVAEWLKGQGNAARE